MSKPTSWWLGLWVAGGCGSGPMPVGGVAVPWRSSAVLGDVREADFAAGVLVSTVVDGAGVSLEEGAETGRFRSRVIDPGGRVSVTAVSWVPDAPYGKPAPRLGGLDVGYAVGGIDMSGTALLLSFDGLASPLTEGSVLPDASGQGADAVVVGDMGSEPGIFGEALVDPLDSYALVRVGAGHPLQLGTDDITWSAWVSMTLDCPPDDYPLNNRVVTGSEEVESDRTHLWFGCKSSVSSSCGVDDGTSRFGGTFRSGEDEAASYCSTSSINDGAWRHLTVVKEGHDLATLSTYVDGALETTVEASFGTPFTFEDDVEWTIGGFRGGSYPSESLIDELMVVKRAWSSEEVLDAYRRGRTAVEVAVRACDDPDCGDDPPWIGGLMDGVDLAGPPLVRGVSVDGRYLQYELTLTRHDPALAVRVGEVVFTGSVEPLPEPTGDTGAGGGTGDTGPPADAEPPTHDTATTPRDSGMDASEPQGSDEGDPEGLAGACGCRQVDVGPGLAWLLIGLFALRRRRFDARGAP